MKRSYSESKLEKLSPKQRQKQHAHNLAPHGLSPLPVQGLSSLHGVPRTSSLKTPASPGGIRSQSLMKSGSISRLNLAQEEEVVSLHTVDYHRVQISELKYEGAVGVNQEKTANQFINCLKLRKKFVWRDPAKHDEKNKFTRPVFQPPKMEDKVEVLDCSFKMVDGVVQVCEGKEFTEDAKTVTNVPSMKEFVDALETVMETIHTGPCKSYAHKRLALLEKRFEVHQLLNTELEYSQQQLALHRDFYNVRKIDNHVHHSACMNQKHLLRFIKSKTKKCGDEKVIIRNGVELTLNEVFDSLGIKPRDLNVDLLDMHADDAFHRFDKFNLKYNPIGESRLREIFLKFNNHIKGRYLAEVTQQVFDDHATNKYQLAEYRLSIYGRKMTEWDTLAAWVVDNNLYSEHTRWMIQIPRLFAVYRRGGLLDNFQQMIDHIFIPLFEVTLDPMSHPKLHLFLQHCVGFDTVDDESLRERPFVGDTLPADWKQEENPPYSMFSYYIYANLTALNQLRAKRGLGGFDYRPHAGEAGDVEHLACTFLTAHSINHGLVLKKAPALQYLYYMCQMGLSMSPLSNNLLFVEYDKNPFPKFFARGLNVTLSTDDPLMIHVTKEPLVEEYSVAAQVWKLSSIDTCEIARNSVLQSGFDHQSKLHWLGKDYFLRSPESNDTHVTNVPKIRIAFRLGLLDEEFTKLSALAKRPVTKEMLCDPL